ncbi:MAG: hypothetical protein LBL21_04825 [Rickettsiales bacterium]|jgi:opacity protein-like surface antigen|nr:hypothetical protein [Rickettsiales bacterium]
MKKLLAILLLVPCLAMAEETEGEKTSETATAPATEMIEARREPRKYDRYVMTSYVWSNLAVSTDGAWPADHTFSYHGYGVEFGGRRTENIQIGGEFDFLRFGFNSQKESDSVSMTVLMSNVMFGKEFFGFLRPYVGAGLGVALANNSIEYNRSYYVGATFHQESGTKDAVRLNFAYQAMAGLTFAITKVFDLDVGVRWKNLGKVGNKIDYFDISGNVTKLEYRIGGAYKW